MKDEELSHAHRRLMLITDAGGPLVATPSDGSPPFSIGRYAVWTWTGHRHEVVDTGDDLDALQAQYGPLRVVPLNVDRKPS